MKKFTIVLIMLIFLLTACSDRKDLEKTTIALAIGIDVAEDNQIIAYESNPIFGEEIAENTETLSATALTLREAREKMNAEANGPVVGGKLQILLVSKELLEQQELYSVLDVLYRDAKNSTNARLVMTEDSIADILNTKMPEKPIISVYLSNLIDNSYDQGITASTTLRDYHYQHYEKGLTPYLSELKKKDGKIVVKGVALLDNDGKFVTSLNPRESSLLQILQKEVKYPVHIIIQIPEHVQIKKNGLGQVSFHISTVDQEVKVKHKDGRFTFDIHSELNILITEMPFKVNMNKDKNVIEKLISKALEEEYKGLLEKIQDNEIDPIGLGLFARAYEYDAWKTVQDDWGKALAEAEVSIKTDVNIISYGVLK
ncbi:Ger(x)C family spore germination protein [Pseudalkalibacillus sp. Hm43]|uniref:Ger(x)C family spore germination protein n=1 Tax=Pseudalkalibacillus sp. Hm43 TaxID=3450742 RepID=UPI003F43C6AE